MPIPGTITVLQPIAPNSPNDIGPSHLARYGLGGIHSVGTTAERDAISFVRREVGMLAYVSSLNKYYSLVGSTSNTGWVEFTVDAVGDGNPAGPNGAVQFRDGTGFSGVSSLTYNSAAGLLVLGSDAAIEFGDGSVQRTARNFYGLTGVTSPDYPTGVSGTGYTGDRLLLATGSSADPFRNYVRFGNAWFQTGVVGIGQGPQGIQGTAGERGTTGATGLSGEKGERGETGSSGEPGERGATGPTGERGATGFGGATGPEGALQFNHGGQLSGDAGLIFDSGTRNIVLGSDVAIEFGDGSVQRTARNFYGLTGATSSEYPQGVSSTGYTGDRLLVTTGPAVDPFRNYIRFNNQWFQTGIAAISQGPVGATGERGQTGERGVTGTQIVLIHTLDTTMPPVVVKGSSPHSMAGYSIGITYAGAAPATAGIFLTDPTKGTGFPAYFPTSQMNAFTFTTETITGNVGDPVTLRIVVTASDGSYDVQDYTITIGNEFRWGKSNQSSLTAGDISAILTNTIPKNDLQHQFFLHAQHPYGEYIYYVQPTRLGKSKQTINNAAYGGMALQSEYGIPGEPSLTYANANGYEEAFYVYRSENRFVDSSLLVRTIPVP